VPPKTKTKTKTQTKKIPHLLNYKLGFLLWGRIIREQEISFQIMSKIKKIHRHMKTEAKVQSTG
jgi:hypothetical protein